MAKKIIWSSILVMIILSASIYFIFQGDNDFKVDIQNTRTQYFVNETGKWDLAATEYVYLYDGTTKMRSSGRNLIWHNDSNFVYVVRTSNWKDNITTIQTYTFKINEDNINNVPFKNELECINCQGKIVQYEIRDILYDGETKNIKSPFSFGHNMNIEWSDDAYYSKVFQQKVASDKIIIKYRPISSSEIYSVRLFDPAEDIKITLISPENNIMQEFPLMNFNCSANLTSGDGDLTLTNISLWGDFNGTWLLNATDELPDSISYTGVINQNEVYTRFTVTNESKIWNITSDFRCDSEHGSHWIRWTYTYLNGTIVAVTKYVGLTTYTTKIFESPFPYEKVVNLSLAMQPFSGNCYTNNTFIYFNRTDEKTSFPKTITQNTTWACSAGDSDGFYNISENWTATSDFYNPILSITYPENITYFGNITHLNYTASDDYPGYCWFSNDSGATNYSTQTFGNNFTINANFKDNTYVVYCNDTNNHKSSDNVSFFRNKVRFTEATTNSTSTADFNIQNFIYLNVETYEPNKSNTTFNLYSNNIFGEYSDEQFFENDTYEYNFTNLNLDYYFFNVTVCYNDTGDCYSTEERYYGNQTFKLYINGKESDLNIELNTTVNITGNSTVNFGLICLDIDHPDYGNNYTCSNQEVTLNLTFNYFRKKTLWDGLFDRIFNFTFFQVDDENFTFISHQYAEIDGLSFNISSNNNVENVVFYGCNTTNIDRAYQGFLVGNKIYLNQSVDSGGTIFSDYENLTFSNPGNQTIYFYLDDNATLINFTMNGNGAVYGFKYSDGSTLGFADFDDADKILSDTLFLGGYILGKGSDLTSFIFDTFGAGAINTALWILAYSNGAYGGGGDDYSWTIDNKQTGGYLELGVDNFVESFDGDNSGSRALNNYIYANYTFLNSWTPKEIQLALNYSSSAFEDEDANKCRFNHYLDLGTVNVWTSKRDSCIDQQVYSYDCDESASSIETMTFNLHRQENNTWYVDITGIEKTYREYQPSTAVDCGYATTYYNYTAGYWYYSTTNPGGGSPCVSSSGPLSNNITLSNLNWNTAAQFYINEMVYGSYDNEFGEGCKEINSWIRVYFVNQSRYNITNGTFISNSIFDSAGDIISATLDVTGVNLGDSGSTAYLYLSADNGINWESVTDNVEHTFIKPGKNIKWKMDLNLTNPGYKNTTVFFYDVSIQTNSNNVSDLTFDFGGDGIIDYTHTGYLNSTDGPIKVILGSSDISNAFDERRLLYDHTYKIPLIIGSSTIGQLNLDMFNITYDPNPVILNSTAIQDFLDTYGSNETNFSIPIGGINGSVNVSDIKFDYAGGNSTIKITVRNILNTLNVTRYITAYYSRWDYVFGPSLIDFIYFNPKNSTAKNVTPYGQGISTPILNITNYGYGNKNVNLSAYVNDSLGCVNMTFSLTNNKSNGILVNNTNWVPLLNNSNYLNVSGIWLFSDYDCNYSTWRLFNPYIYFSQCCTDCKCDEDFP